MNRPTSKDPREEIRQLQQAIAETSSLLRNARQQLLSTSQEECLMTETPLEVQGAIECAMNSIGEALQRLKAAGSSAANASRPPSPPPPGGPTRQQGKFLAFIREYIMRNESGVPPSHANFQRFFNLTAPSVNSMLSRLEQHGFIRRVPGKVRAIELVINPDLIPPLSRPFKY